LNLARQMVVAASATSSMQAAPELSDVLQPDVPPQPWQQACCLIITGRLAIGRNSDDWEKLYPSAHCSAAVLRLQLREWTIEAAAPAVADAA